MSSRRRRARARATHDADGCAERQQQRSDRRSADAGRSPAEAVPGRRGERRLRRAREPGPVARNETVHEVRIRHLTREARATHVGTVVRPEGAGLVARNETVDEVRIRHLGRKLAAAGPGAVVRPDAGGRLADQDDSEKRCDGGRRADAKTRVTHGAPPSHVADETAISRTGWSVLARPAPTASAAARADCAGSNDHPSRTIPTACSSRRRATFVTPSWASSDAWPGRRQNSSSAAPRRTTIIATSAPFSSGKRP